MDLQEFSKKLITYGFRVWYDPRDSRSKSVPTHLFVAINGNMGWVRQVDDGSYTYYTVYKLENSGCSFYFDNGALTIGAMRDCCNAGIPQWAESRNRQAERWDPDAWIAAHPHLVEIT